MRWGDDYELLFTLPQGISAPVAAFRIGEVIARSDSPVLIDGQPPKGRLGYTHG